MAVVFGRYADSLFDLGPDGPLIYAVASIILLTIVHILGVEPGRWTQNLLTAAKLLGLGLVLGAGLLSSGAPPAQAAAPGQANLFLAAIFVLFAYGGWNEMAYVAAEVRDPARSIPRAILLGVGLVIAVYLLVAAGALRALGFAGLCQSEVMARDVVQQFLGPFSGGFVSTLICLSTLGAVHGMLFTGARLGYALGRTHLAFAPLARWNRTFGTPAVSLAAQGALTLALALAAQALRPADPFEGLTIATTPAYWAFVLLVFAAALVFRLRDRRDQPAGHYRAPFFPAVIALATVAVVALLIGAANYALATRPPEFLLFAGVLLLGLALAAAFPPSPGEHGPSAP
jgi:amino acid transporter